MLTRVLVYHIISFTVEYPANAFLASCPSLRQVLKSCLQRDPTKRPSVAKLLVHPFLSPSVMKDININADQTGTTTLDTETSTVLQRLVAGLAQNGRDSESGRNLVRNADAIRHLYAEMTAIETAARTRK